MATPILMPRQGNTVEECLLASWKKKKGDTVKKGDLIADIETDKATFELEAPEDGVILELFCTAGTLVPVMTNIAVIGTIGEDYNQYKPEAKVKKVIEKKGESAPTSKPNVVESTKNSPIVITENGQSSELKGVLSPRAKKFLKLHPNLSVPKFGSGVNGRIIETDLIEKYNSAPRVTPLASALVTEGWRLPKSGTGVGGSITKTDLLPPGKVLSPIRTIIASRMKESLSSTAQYTVSMKGPATQLLSLRKKIKPLAELKKLADISINDLVNFVTVKALLEFPELNSELINSTLYTYKNVNLAFACDTPKGLLVPVINNAHKMTISELAIATKALANNAIDGRILPESLNGGTFTVSNLGSFGVTEFTPVINTPQTAILGVCGISVEAVRSKYGTIVFEDKIGLSLTSDHQVIDGAVAAKFLRRVCELLANIETVSGLF